MCMSSTMAKCLFKVLVSCYVCVPEGDQSSSVLCISKKLYPNFDLHLLAIAICIEKLHHWLHPLQLHAPIWLWAVLYLFAQLLESSRKFSGPIPTFQLCRGKGYISLVRDTVHSTSTSDRCSMVAQQLYTFCCQ